MKLFSSPWLFLLVTLMWITLLSTVIAAQQNSDNKVSMGQSIQGENINPNQQNQGFRPQRSGVFKGQNSGTGRLQGQKYHQQGIQQHRGNWDASQNKPNGKHHQQGIQQHRGNWNSPRGKPYGKHPQQGVQQHRGNWNSPRSKPYGKHPQQGIQQNQGNWNAPQGKPNGKNRLNQDRFKPANKQQFKKANKTELKQVSQPQLKQVDSNSRVQSEAARKSDPNKVITVEASEDEAMKA